MPVGYSGTPLPRKLGITATTVLCAIGTPQDYATLLGEIPSGARISPRLTGATNLVHLFVTRQGELATRLAKLRSTLGPEVAVWVSWPKKASKVPATVSEDTIRDVALPLGYVDIKVCAVSDVWSGLKLVVRKELR